MHAISSFTESRMAELLSMEHYRLHNVERWPEGANKDTALAGIRSALVGLLRACSGDTAGWACIVCGSSLFQRADRAGFSREA